MNEVYDQWENRNLFDFMEHWEAEHQQEQMDDDREEEEQEGGAMHGPFQPLYRFHVDDLVDRRSDRLGVREQVATVRLRRNDQAQEGVSYNLSEQLSLALTMAIKRLLDAHGYLDGRDRLYFTINSDRLRNAYDGWGVTVGEWHDPSTTHRVDRVFENLAMMLNSNEEFDLDDSFTLTLTVVRMSPRGSGGGKKRKRAVAGKVTACDFEQYKRFLIDIPDMGDNLCCAKALVVSKARVTMPYNEYRSKYGDKTRRKSHNLRSLARLLHFSAAVPVGIPCGGEELTKFANAWPDVTIIVVDANRCYECYKYGDGPTKVGLYLRDGHYWAVTNIPSLFVGNYWCWHCMKKYDHLGRHACTENTDHCPRCRQDVCKDYLHDRQYLDRSQHLSCRHCRRTFYGSSCYLQHLIRAVSDTTIAPDFSNVVCKMVYSCKDCGKLVNLHSRDSYHGHLCYHAECPSCKEYLDLRTHRCYIQTYDQHQQRKHHKLQQKENRLARDQGRPPRTIPPLPTSSDDTEDHNLYVFFDIESMHVDQVHVPNLVVAQTSQSDEEHVWYGNQCIVDFCQQLERWAKALGDRDDNRHDDEEDDDENNRSRLSSKAKVVVLAHNFQGYDSYPIIQYYHSQCMDIHQVRTGGKVLELTIGGRNGSIRFIDSMSFLPMALDKFTKTFELEHLNLRKGFFPHFFNTPNHQDYDDRLPDKHYYGPDTMSKDRKDKFDKWYDETAAQVPAYRFVFHKELIEYCKSDVRLLKAGCEAFAKEFQSMTHFTPFNHMTIASACSADLRRNRLQFNAIASEPVTGWRQRTNHSEVAIEWLTYLEHQLGYGLQHARSSDGEKRIDDGRHKYYVDGYDAHTNTVYEFHGCFWHGCPKCYKQRTESHQQLYGRNMFDVYTATCRRTQRLRVLGYTVVEKWECEWNQQKGDNDAIASLVKSFHIVSPLEPREAFFGGRTNAVRLYAHTSDNEGQFIGYYDYTSLYPYINKKRCYPLGHPEILHNPTDQNIHRYFGLAKCTVLPPPGLFHPVLPYRCNGKLTFPLCRTCVEDNIALPLRQRQWFCHHTPQQRQITGTWCTPELRTALDNNYTLIRIHEVWDFSRRREGLFENYVNTWLKVKEEASGYPEDCVTDEQRQQHIVEYEQREGIQLDPDRIAYNGGHRTVAKLMLNSMWGKFGQRIDKTQISEFTRAQDLQDFLSSGKYNIRYVSPLTEDRVEVHYKYHSDMIDVSPNLNIFVACFTTCWARLRLYEALDQLKERVLYFDTDSIIFLQDPLNNPSLGRYLGDFKNELSEGEHITEFVSGGPKNYGYKTRKRTWNPVTERWEEKTKEVCKVRGFSLNVEGSRQLNYGVLRQHILSEIGDGQDPTTTTIHESTKIVRDPKQYTLTTQPRDKQYQVVFNKRVIPFEQEGANPYLSYPYGYFQQELMDTD